MTSTATRINRALLASTCALIAFSLFVPIVANTSKESPTSSTATSQYVTSTTSEPSEAEGDGSSDNESGDVGNLEPSFDLGIDPIIGKAFVKDRSLPAATLAYPFDESGPSRRPPLNKHPFLSGIYDRDSYGGGMDQSAFVPQIMEIDQSGLSCYPGFWFNLMACGVASTPRGRFQISVSRTITNNLGWYSSDMLNIDVSYETNRGSKKYSISALQSFLISDKCTAGGQDTITLDKVRVGDEELFIITTHGNFGTDSNDFVGGFNVFVVGMNATGVPEIVASYQVPEVKQIAATDRSLMLTFDTYEGSSEIVNGSGVVAELLPQSGNWIERLHPIDSDEDPLWRVAAPWNYRKNKTPGLGHPLRLLDYTSLFYSKQWEEDTFCSSAEYD